jgi:DNA-binding NarL/FixJ family response regulator
VRARRCLVSQHVNHAAVREAIASSFKREAGFEVVGEGGWLKEARPMLEEVDVAVVDLGRILSKLGVHSRLQAAVFAARHGLVEIA